MNIAIIVSSGKGTRIRNYNLPKQFIVIKNQPIIAYTLKTFQNASKIDKILVVTSKEYFSLMQEICLENKITKLISIVEGGKTRQESVYNALKYLKEYQIKDDDIILIHDGVRALISEEIITNNIKASEKYDGVSTALKVKDTIIKVNEEDILEQTLNRDELYQVQTPQTFKFKIIYNAHLKYANNFNLFTDDATLVKSLKFI